MATPRRSSSTVLPVLLLALATALLILNGSPARAVALQGWELVGPDEEAVDTLIAPAGGVLFAVAPYDLPPGQPDQRGVGFVLRSDDGGRTWQPVASLPRPLLGLAIDPVDPTIVYAAGPDGIHKSDDDAKTWRLVHPVAGEDAFWIVISPADHQVVYAKIADVRRTHYRLLRSLDGGATWEVLREQQAESALQSCDGVHLTAHPTDRARVFGWLTCEPFPIQTAQLDESADQGATWSPVFGPSTQFPLRLVGGGGAAPDRFYLLASQLASRDQEISVFRSDDGAKSWAPTGDALLPTRGV